MVRDYIIENIEKTVCTQTADNGDLLGMPYPYTVPTEGDMFHCMYYWDTYFTNLGLLRIGKQELAKNNVDNMLYLIRHFGFMPNANRERYLSRSQPPFLSLMVKDIYEATQDNEWLAEAYGALCIEHEFWQSKRATSLGLNRYGRKIEPENIEIYAERYYKRTGLRDIPQELAAESYLANAESGWDCNPRWGDKGENDFCAPDLNSLLWACEDNLCKFSEILGLDDAKKWRSLADSRISTMQKLLINPENGLFFDRGCSSGKLSDVVSLASLYPLYVGMATEEQAQKAVAALPLLEREHGVVPCYAPHIKGTYQWNAPNAWPCLQVIAAVALDNYGYKGDALRIAKKYVDMVDSVFASTGGLWEKYNADSGSCDTVNEYQTPNMLGWTAGAYIFLRDYIQK